MKLINIYDDKVYVDNIHLIDMLGSHSPTRFDFKFLIMLEIRNYDR
jgi:hypothetical protein